jgi:glycosyltransferase involved in cell wall biosynthesis
MKLNLGCGGDHRPGWVNVDKYPEAKPDKVMDLERLPWPLEDDCADEILLKHVLEHLGRDTDTFLGIMKELYRVTKPGGKVHIWVPHPRHSDFLADPTHCRPVLPDLFLHFSLDVNRDWQQRGLPGTPLAMYLGLDFQIEASTLHLDPHWLGQWQSGRLKAEELDYAIRSYNNVVQQVEVVLRAQKPFGGVPGATELKQWRPWKQTEPLPVIWEGTMFRNHSLSKINREVGKRLVAFPGLELRTVPYEPDDFDPRADAKWKGLLDTTYHHLSAAARVHVRHQWPPRWDAPEEGAWVLFQHWEYGVIPQPWVAPLRAVDEIWVLSEYTRQCFVGGGIPPEKVVVLPGGVDTVRFTPEGSRYPLPTKKRVKFLFLGGTIPRKGIDILMRAFRKAFTAKDDVTLVIKGNPSGAVYSGSDIAPQVEAWRKDPEAPELIYLAEDLNESALADLYRACDVFVLPSRGEGFGMPVAEAMACGLPAIVTGRGACRDFCDETNALLLPSRQVPLGTMDGLPPAGPSYWLEEPDEVALVEAMQQLAQDPELRTRLGHAGRARICSAFTWEHLAHAIQERMKALASRPPLRQIGLEQSKTGFLLKPAQEDAAWRHALESYLTGYPAGGSTLLVLDLTEGPTADEIKEVLWSLLQAAGLETFPDLALAEDVASLEELLASCAQVTSLSSPPQVSV